MNRRVELHKILASLLDSGNVYFQPPATVKMRYPCITYRRSRIDATYAGDAPYVSKIRYQVTVIDADPDSQIPEKVGKLPLSRFERHFTADNLNHDVYDVYY
jgi:hypothetical protein